MSDVPISDATVQIYRSRWRRLFPNSGMAVDHESFGSLSHFDAECLAPSILKFLNDAEAADVDYPKTNDINRGTGTDNAYRIVSFKNGMAIGSQTFIEWKGNPDGYGPGDFCNTRYFLPEYQGSDYINFAQEDVFQCLFSAGVSRIYVYAPAGDSAGAPSYSSYTKGNPCLPPQRPDLNASKLKYCSFPKRVTTSKGGNYVITEIDGKKYLQFAGESRAILAAALNVDAGRWASQIASGPIVDAGLEKIK